MAEDPIRQFSNAVEEFNKAYSRARELGMQIAEVGRYMNNRPHVFEIVNSGLTFPREISLAQPAFRMDANNWSTAKQIAQAILTLHEKREMVKKLYKSLSGTDKGLVQKPDLCESH